MTAVERRERLLEQLANAVIIGDGAMGTLLYRRGVPLESSFEQLNVAHPDLVRQAHRDYATAGARLLETNTFGANRPRLAAHGHETEVREINLAGARLARQAAGQERWVAGAVGPLPRSRGTGQELSREERAACFREQLEALAEGGVDLFLLETFADLEELLLALETAAEFGLPAAAQMAFMEGGRTREGITAAVAVERLTAAGAVAVGANCGSGPAELAGVLREMAKSTGKALSAFPNSGLPQYYEGRLVYLATPDYFASRCRELVEAGVSLVGGCCGTTPEHIRALAELCSGLRPGPRPVPEAPRAAVPAAEPGSVPRRNFLEDWGRRPVVTVELDPPRGLDCSRVLEQARRLALAGVDAISLAENPLARIRMGNLALARLIQEETGLEVIAHVTCRDRNLIGLHSELMGAHLLGVHTILAVTGDPVAVGGESGATSVFDLNSVGLLELLASLNDGRSLLGADLGGRTDFLLGAAFNPNPASLAGQLRRLRRKIDAGARFVQTQPVYSEQVLQGLLEVTGTLGIPVLIGLLPLVSQRNAEFLHNEVPGITLPREVLERMEGKAGREGEREGMAICRELVAAAGSGAGGYYLMPPFGRVELALELVEIIRNGRS